MSKQTKKKKLIKLQSTQMWSPIKDILDGIVITKDSRFVQIMEFAPVNFILLPESEQEAIANAFGSAIKTFPKKFHIKVLSRKADVETHIQNIRKCMEQETNERCRALQQQSIYQIRKDSFSGVSRRFFLSFEYDEPSGLRSPSWNEIKTNLHFQASQIAQMLSDRICNNELLSEIGDSEHILDILYNCMCRKEAELKSLDAKVTDVLCTHIAEHGYDPEGNAKIPINDFISPQRIDPHMANQIAVDGKYYCFGYIPQNIYPTECYPGWFSHLVSMGEGIDIDIWVEQKNTKEIQPQLTYTMQITESNYINKGNTSADFVNVRNKMQSEKYIQEGLTHDQNFCYFSIMVSVVGDSAEEVRRKYKAVQNKLIALGLDLRPMLFSQDAALKSSLPLCAPDKYLTRYAQRNILSGDLGAFYPFTSYEINDPGGVQVGRNRANKSPMFLDLYNRQKYINGNMVIFGSSGSGKTFLLQLLAMRLRQQQTQVIIIAPYKGHEYGKACMAIGGTYIRLSPDSPQTINVMEIRKYDTSVNEQLDGEFSTGGSILTAQIQQMRAFFTLLKPDMTKAEEAILDEALIETYKERGITKRNKSLLDPKNPNRYKTMPTLNDLDRFLSRKKDSKGLRDALSLFVGNGSCKILSEQTNVNLDNPYVVIDVSDMPDKLMPVAIHIANGFAYDTIKADRLKKKAIIIDEASRLIGPQGTPMAAEFVLKETKLIRAYNGILIIATQDTNDFFALENGKYGKGILASSKLKIVMKQEPEEVPTITEKLMLSESESSRLIHLDRGEGLLIANRNHCEIEVIASAQEERLITTDPNEIAQLHNIRREG